MFPINWALFSLSLSPCLSLSVCVLLWSGHAKLYYSYWAIINLSYWTMIKFSGRSFWKTNCTKIKFSQDTHTPTHTHSETRSQRHTHGDTHTHVVCHTTWNDYRGRCFEKLDVEQLPSSRLSRDRLLLPKWNAPAGSLCLLHISSCVYWLSLFVLLNEQY